MLGTWNRDSLSDAGTRPLDAPNGRFDTTWTFRDVRFQAALEVLSGDGEYTPLTVSDVVHPPAVDGEHLRRDPTRLR